MPNGKSRKGLFVCHEEGEKDIYQKEIIIRCLVSHANQLNVKGHLAFRVLILSMVKIDNGRRAP